MIPAHFMARAVDVLPEAVYLYREREDGSRSITDRRAELPVLLDRLRAVETVERVARRARAARVDGGCYAESVVEEDLRYHVDVLDEAGRGVPAGLPRPRERVPRRRGAGGRGRPAGDPAAQVAPRPPAAHAGAARGRRLPQGAPGRRAEGADRLAARTATTRSSTTRAWASRAPSTGSTPRAAGSGTRACCCGSRVCSALQVMLLLDRQRVLVRLVRVELERVRASPRPVPGPRARGSRARGRCAPSARACAHATRCVLGRRRLSRQTSAEGSLATHRRCRSRRSLMAALPVCRPARRRVVAPGAAATGGANRRRRRAAPARSRASTGVGRAERDRP